MKNIINLRPILYFAVSVCMGILTAYSFLMSKIALAVTSIIIFVISTVTVCLLKQNKTRSFVDKPKSSFRFKATLIVFATLLSVIAGLNFSISVNDYDNADMGSSNYYITANVTETKPTENGSALVLSDVNVKGKVSGDLKYKVLLYVNGSNSFDIGDEIAFTARLNDRGIIYENKFSSHYVAEGVKYTAIISADEIELKYQNRNLFESVNVFIRDTLKSGLDEKEFSVAYALLCGNSEYMPDEVITNFRAAGVAHIFAVSGLHIGFLALVLNFIAGKLRFNKYFKFVFVLSILIFYSGVCGFTASSIRATVMTAVLLISELIGKKYDGMSSVSTAFLAILLFAPVQLFCVGFQLSFGVVIGILLLSRPISKIFKFLPNKISSSLGVVLSAQIVGIPISLAAFGEISLIAIIANFIFIPFVGFIYVLTLTSTLLGGIFSIPTITLFPANYVLKFIIMLITAFDYRIFMYGGFSFFVFNGAYYLTFIVWTDKLNLKTITRSIICVLSAITFAVGVTLCTIFERKDVKLIAVGGENASATVLSSLNDTAVIISSFNVRFNTGKLLKALDSVNSDDIDTLVITNSVNKIDVQVAVSVLIRKCSIKNVYYYGAEDSTLQILLEKSFKNVKFTRITDGFVCRTENYQISLALDGNCAVIKTDDSLAYLFSEFGDYKANYVGLDANPNVIFAVDYVDGIYATYSPDEIYCYRNSVYPNALKMGNVLLKI